MEIDVRVLMDKHQELVNSRGHVFEWSLRQISPGVLDFISHLGSHLIAEVKEAFPPDSSFPEAEEGPLRFAFGRALLGGYWVHSAELMIQGTIPRPNAGITEADMHHRFDHEPPLDTSSFPEAVMAALEFYNGHMQKQAEMILPGLKKWPDAPQECIRTLLPKSVLSGYVIGLLEETFPRPGDLLGDGHSHGHGHDHSHGHPHPHPHPHKHGPA